MVQVPIRDGDEVGYGEGAPDPRYGESCESALDFWGQVVLLLGDDPDALEARRGGSGSVLARMAAKWRSRRCLR